MPKVYKRTIGSRSYGNYSEDVLQECLQAVKTGRMTQRAAETYFKIPRRTINYKLRGQHSKRPGKPTIFLLDEEEAFVECVIQMSNFGFPIDTFDLKHIVKNYLQIKGRTVKQFKNNLPGDDWVKSFMKRHQGLTVRFATNIKKARAGINKQTLVEYISNLKEVVQDVPKENIWNYDETNLSDDPGQKRVLTKRGMKYPETICNTSKTSISLMYCGSAAGQLIPPYVVYKSAHMWNTWTENGPKGTRYNNTQSGWFDTFTFVDWFKSMLLPRLKQLEGKKVLIGDNLSSHITPDVLNLCLQNDIFFVCLPPNSTHITQPLDVAFFGPLKKKWRHILSQYKDSPNGIRNTVLQKQDFPMLLKELHESIMTNAAENLKSGFLKCGIYPCSVVPLLEKLPSTGTRFNVEEVESSFTQFLEEKRQLITGSAGPKRGRKRVHVEAGKSIAHDSSMSFTSTSTLPSPSSSNIPDTNATHRKNKKVSESHVEDIDHSVPFQELPDSERSLGGSDEDVPVCNVWKSIKRVCGEFVVFEYEGEMFPGQVMEIKDNSVVIKAMQRSLKSWKWPAKEDIMEYEWGDVLGGIDTPKQISRRGFYSVPELNMKWL